MPVQIEASVIGRNCHIGRGAHITGCYLLDNVRVGDQAQVSHSLLCDGVQVGAHAMVFPGSVLSFRVSPSYRITLAALSIQTKQLFEYSQDQHHQGVRPDTGH